MWNKSHALKHTYNVKPVISTKQFSSWLQSYLVDQHVALSDHTEVSHQNKIPVLFSPQKHGQVAPLSELSSQRDGSRPGQYFTLIFFFFPEWCEKCLKTKKIRISVSFIIKSKANSCPKLQQQHKLLPFPWRHLRLWALPVNKLVAAAAAKDDKTIPEKGSHVTSVKQFGLAKFHVEQAAVQCRTIDCKNGQADGFQKRSHHKSRSPWWLVVA